VDVIVIDPRASTPTLTITRVRGVTNSHRTTAWEAPSSHSTTARWPGLAQASSIRGAGAAAKLS